MNNKFFSALVISCLLTSCARVESPQAITAVPEEVEQFDLTGFYGAKQKVMVYPWNISKIDLQKYPILSDHRIGFGVSNRLTDILFDVNRFEFIEEKQEIAKRLVAQMQLCKTPDVCQDGGIKNLQLRTADYIIYPEVYHFGIEKQTDITGVDTTNRQYVEIGIQVNIVNAHTGAMESSGSYIGQKILTSQGDIFNNPRIDFSQSALGKATDAAIKGAIAKMLKRFDRIAAKIPASTSPVSILASAEPVVTQRGSNSSKTTTLATGSSADSNPILVPVHTAQKRLALVIGNAEYRLAGASLANAAHDAEDVSKMLTQLGFDVSLYLNLNKQGTEQAIQAFGQKLKTQGKGVAALFYYAGHAAEVEGVNYMFPVDVQLKGEAQVDSEAVAVQTVIEQIQMVGNDLNILLLDACRDNPYPPQKRRFISKYNRLATMRAPVGTIISYSTASGKTASDGLGGNGLYTGELLKNIIVPHLKIEDVFKRVRIAVSEKTGKDQIAWDNSSLVGDFYFIPPQ